ncbi:MAG: trimethylamine methyltransferase family protein [Dehalococcoidales bacterium]
MRANYIQYGSPQFRILSDNQIEELHFATLHILERTGVAFDCREAIELLDGAGVDVSNPDRIKIPSYLVEQAIRTAPKTITLYTREGERAITGNGLGSHFGAMCGTPKYLEPYSRKQAPCYVTDIADTARVVDALPNIEWLWTISGHPTVPGTIADKVSLLQALLNTSKPVACGLNDAASLREMIEVCSIIAGGEEELRKRPFFLGSSEPVTPLTQDKDAMEKSLLCAEKGIPNFIFGLQMAGATAPATWPAVLAIASAEALSQLVVIQLKNPGAPVIFGAMPDIMDMRTTIACYGAPELAFLIAAATELAHYYQLPMLGTAGCTDADVINTQASAEVTYQIHMAALSGADFVHDVGLMYHSEISSPELMVFCNEIIDMVGVSMGGIEINEETLPLDLIDRVGPRGNYISEKHTLKHFKKFWTPKIFDRSVVKREGTKNCEDLLNEMTIKIIETHQPKPLPEDVLKELAKIEAGWLKRVGLKEYPKKAS